MLIFAGPADLPAVSEVRKAQPRQTRAATTAAAKGLQASMADEVEGFQGILPSSMNSSWLASQIAIGDDKALPSLCHCKIDMQHEIIGRVLYAGIDSPFKVAWCSHQEQNLQILPPSCL